MTVFLLIWTEDLGYDGSSYQILGCYARLELAREALRKAESERPEVTDSMTFVESCCSIVPLLVRDDATVDSKDYEEGNQGSYGTMKIA